jgi:triosephosphate isomerase
MKKIIIGNWKMAPETLKEAKATFAAIKTRGSRLRNVQTVICAPFVYVSDLAKMVGGHRVAVGAENTHWEESGAFTGEVSACQIASVKAQYVIVGHSERRAMGETDDDVAKKVAAVFRGKMIPVLCVGERTRDDHGEYTRFIIAQIQKALTGLKRSQVRKLIIAYEPIWAIGSHAIHPATPADALEISILIRKTIADIWSKNEAFAVPILYGGSADETNAEGFLREGEMQGLLVGRASLDPKKFNAILEIAERI